ncbi:MAG: hypothetical protein Q8R02_08880 [Hyphomonadaceae bacterium]|nr:hypothetical protein [Hyphomonadaceae bacterium]
MPLRRDLQRDAAAYGVEVVLGEDDPLIDEAAQAGDHIAILEGCARLIGTCQAFFGMVFERHGSKVVVSRDPFLQQAQVSFFEAELLEACFQSMPCCVVQVRDMQPSASMQAFLALVSNTLGSLLLTADRGDVPEEFHRFAKAAARGEAGISPWLFDPVSIGRVKEKLRQERLAPHLSFLSGGLRRDNGLGGDADLIRKSIGQVTDAKRQGRPMGHITRLTHLWIAIRELANTDSARRAADLNPELQTVLGLWNESAAWHGLHGSHPMGCLATLNELAHARDVGGESNPPHHPRASAYHSIGNKIRLPVTARRFYHQAISLCQAGLARPGADRITLRQQRASAHARLALLGEKWRYALALRDFRFAFDGRVRAAAATAKIAESQTEYAHALSFLSFRRNEALRLMEEGLALFESDPRHVTNDFYFRAAGKHGQMLTAAGDLDRAEDVLTRAASLAEANHAFDQLRNLEKLLAAVRDKKGASR